MRPPALVLNLIALGLASLVVLVNANPVQVVQRDSDFSESPQKCARLPIAPGYFDPRLGGGSMLDASAGLGEPLNVIISGFSSPDILDATGKFYNYANAIGFSYECLGLHLGNAQQANLGDGRSWVNQTAVLRQDYGNSVVGTCKESLVGGNHFRIYQQEGTCAMFLAVSIEEDAFKHHDIVPNGYNLGRDQLVAAAVGERSFNGVKYTTTAMTLYGLLPNGSGGINHDIAIDGKVVLLTVTIHE